MKNILYIGNKLEKHGNSPTSVDILPLLFEKEGFEVISCSSKKNKIFRVLDFTFHIFDFRKKSGIVLIDTYSTLNFWFAVWSGFLCWIFHIPYIPILRGGGLGKRLEKNKSASKLLFKNSRINISPSIYIKQVFNSQGFKNVKYIPNNIPLENYNFKLRKYIRPKLIWVRAFDEVYNPVLALDVLEQLLKRYPDAELLMVGPEKDGSLKKCQQIAGKKNLPVTFTGKLSKQEWTDLAKEYDIFINTSSVDNTPVSVIEAMALGLPVVSSEVGGVPYLIEDGKNGILVEPDNAVAMTDAVFNLLNDAELSHTISLNARKSAEKYDWEQVRPLWLELLS